MATQMEHDQSSYFCRCPAPVGPTLVTGLRKGLLLQLRSSVALNIACCFF